MKRDLILTRPITSSFLSCEKDTEIILQKLFVQSRPYSDILKSLLIIQARDCLDNLDKYKAKLDAMSIAKMIEDGYIALSPRLELKEHEQVKAYLSLSFDNFTANATNPEFRDCMIHFDVLCHHDYWELGNYRARPFKILGYIDGILNRSKLTGIGTVNFVGCTYTNINEDWSFYTLTYQAIHGSDDQIEDEEE